MSADGIQHDATTGVQFQGGPLLDSAGHVVGILPRTYSPLGFPVSDVWFAVPPDAACSKVLVCPNGTPTQFTGGQPGSSRRAAAPRNHGGTWGSVAAVDVVVGPDRDGTVVVELDGAADVVVVLGGEVTTGAPGVRTYGPPSPMTVGDSGAPGPIAPGATCRALPTACSGAG